MENTSTSTIVTETVQQPDLTLTDSAALQSRSVIEIGLFESIVGLAVIVFVAGKAWGNIKKTVDHVSKTLDEQIVPDLKDVRDRFLVVEDHVDTLWKDKIAPAHSPRQLNDRGEEILTKSGIKEIVDMKKKVLLDLVKESILEKKIDNAYDAEREIEQIMNDLPDNCPDVVKRLKDGAFKVGREIPAVLFVGSIYLRNLIFSELGFNLNDLDVPVERKVK